MFNIWASHSSTQQDLVDEVDSAIAESSVAIQLLHYRSTFVDADGNPYSEDQLAENEEIGRLISDIGDSRGVVFFLCENFLKSPVCLAELMAVIRHKYNDHFAVVRYDKSEQYIKELVAAISQKKIGDLVEKSLLRRENYKNLNKKEIEKILRERLTDKLYTSPPEKIAIKESLEKYVKANIKKRPAFDYAAHYRQWVSYGEGRDLRDHFNTYPKMDESELYADYIAKELFENGNIHNIRKLLPSQLQDYIKFCKSKDDTGDSLHQAFENVRIFGGYFSLLLFDKDWVAQQNCLVADRVQVNLQLQDSKNNPFFINVIIAGLLEKIPRISLSEEWLTGQDCLLQITDKIGSDAGSEDERRKAYYRKIVDSLWWALNEEEAPSDESDLKERLLLSRDNRGRLIGDFNNRFGKGSGRVAYVEIDQPTINNLAPQIALYLDQYVNELNAEIADDPQEENLHIPMVLIRTNEHAPQFKGVQNKISLLKEIIKISEMK